ncbi:MAG: hypothetical protein AAE977_04245 [Thermoplasmataceae archaeon]|jgi:hypothetical protein
MLANLHLEYGLVILLSLFISWVFISIPFYYSGKVMTDKSNMSRAMAASLFVVIALFFFSLIPIIGTVIGIIASIFVISFIYEISLIRAFFMAILAVVFYFIIVLIIGAIFGLGLIILWGFRVPGL